MSYSFGNVQKDISAVNISTGRLVSNLSVSETVNIVTIGLGNLPVATASNIIYIDPATGIISRDIPIGGGATGATGATGTSYAGGTRDPRGTRGTRCTGCARSAG